eukprot:2539879-Amphidinium_carterae.1
MALSGVFILVCCKPHPAGQVGAPAAVSAVNAAGVPDVLQFCQVTNIGTETCRLQKNSSQNRD